MLLIVFTVSMFVSAMLLFLVEPMLTKMALPMLGGTPAVWNTCLMFFQAMLLAGYLYAHATLRWLGPRTQIALHVALVLLPVAIRGMLPLHLPAGWEPPAAISPVPWMLAMLLVSVGLPFFLLSSSTPVLQRWFAQSGHRLATDPYFLYAASNAGSLAGLIAYPLLLEPLLRLSVQSRWWSYGYFLFVAMTVVCALLAWRPVAQQVKVVVANVADEGAAARARWERMRWIALALVPSSLMIGVSTALTTDVPAIPLFWVLPLALYLLSFVLVFARRPRLSHEWLVRRLPFLILASLIPTVTKTKLPVVLLLLIYSLTLFAVAMVCHGELARSRPRAARLTEFYLWISVGGVLGGIFNCLVAPVVFHSVVEFPLALVFAALLRPRTALPRPLVEAKPLSGAQAAKARRNDFLLPVALGLCMVTVILGLAHVGVRPSRSMNILIFGYAILWCLSFGKRPLRFAPGVAALIIASSLYTGPFGHILHTERSFFGVSRVTDDPAGRFRYLFHGGTIHGMQSLDPARSREPLAYYSRSGPAGEIFAAQQGRMPSGDWAIVGLGAGAMACYLPSGEGERGSKEQTLTYYEIDPTVMRIAENPRYFTFLTQCAPTASIVLGDARLKLRDAPDGQYGLIVLDAFSGDTIPMHLMTREALALYLRKLAPGGLLAFHISNLYLQLAPTLGNLAQDAHLVCLSADDTFVSQAQIDEGKFPSIWVVMARTSSDLAALAAGGSGQFRWQPIADTPGARVWTDDYSNLLRIIKWD